MYRLVFGVGLGWLLLALPMLAGAQSTSWHRPLTYQNGQLSQLPGGGALLHQLTPLTESDMLLVRHAAFDSLLRERHQWTTVLRGFNVQLANHALNRRAALYRFRRQLNDTAFTAVVDTAGRLLSLRRERRRQPLPPVLPLPASLTLPVDSLFLLATPLRGNKGFELECLDLQQRPRWKLPFAHEGGLPWLLDYQADAQYLWLVTSDNYPRPTANQTVWCLELATGRVVAQVALDQPGQHRAAAVSLLRPDHSLVLTGEIGLMAANGRVRPATPDNLFVLQLQPDGTRSIDTQAPTPGLRSSGMLRKGNVYWQRLSLDGQGNISLLGEILTSASSGSQVVQHIATGVATGLLTGGLLFVGFSSDNLISQDVVRVRFDARGRPLGVQVVPAPGEAPDFYQQGVFRLRAASADGRLVLLRNRHDISLLDLDTGRAQQLRTSPEADDLEVRDYGYDRALLYHTQPGKAARPANGWVTLR